MQIRIATTLPYHQFKEWSKENVKTRTARSRRREGKKQMRFVVDLLGKTSSLERLKYTQPSSVV
ncbi:hypothetical protein T06_5069 [Trichinella sp. T6]|nr:hypothetical protein T06_5069 [Trichinella sp. T6]